MKTDTQQVWTRTDSFTTRDKVGHIEEMVCKGYTIKVQGVLHDNLPIDHIADDCAVTADFIKACLNNPAVFSTYSELIEAKSRIGFLEDQLAERDKRIIEQARDFKSFPWYQMFAACLATAAIAVTLTLINTGKI